MYCIRPPSVFGRLKKKTNRATVSRHPSHTESLSGPELQRPDLGTRRPVTMAETDTTVGSTGVNPSSWTKAPDTQGFSRNQPAGGTSGGAPGAGGAASAGSG